MLGRGKRVIGEEDALRHGGVWIPFIGIAGWPPPWYLFFMTAAYTLAEATKKLPALFKKAVGNPVVITHQNKVVGYLVASGDMEARIESLEVMANPKAMKAIREAKAGRTKYHPVDVLADEG